MIFFVELLSKIETRLRKGEQLDAILTQMGTAKEKANQYNAKIPPKERKTYDRNHLFAFSLMVYYQD